MTDTPKTAAPVRKTRRSGTRATGTTTVAKSATTPAPRKAPQEVTFSLAKLQETKGRIHFDQSTTVDGHDTGCVGKFYAPLGTKEVKVTLVGMTLPTSDDD